MMIVELTLLVEKAIDRSSITYFEGKDIAPVKLLASYFLGNSEKHSNDVKMVQQLWNCDDILYNNSFDVLILGHL